MPGETQNPDPRDTERDKFDNVDFDSIRLAFGGHASREEGMCLLEAVAYVAGEPHTDHPQCVCPVLASFGRAWNDALDDEDRNRLLRPFIRRLIGTRSTPEVEQRRAYMAADWTARLAAPVWLRAAGLVDEAGALEALPPLDSAEACRNAGPTLRRAREAALAARRAGAVDAARVAAARAATGAAAGGGATAAVGAAAWAADWTAAVDAAWAAGAAAGGVAVDAAVLVAGDAAREALRPHVERLQASAVDLYERMIEVAA